MSNSKYVDLINKQRSQKKSASFKGTFLDYLEVVERSPDISNLAHRRLFDSLVEDGVKVLDESNERCRNLFDSEKIKTYNYFQPKFFGMERSLAKIMRFLSSAAMKGEESRQVLLLLGPVGAGKSALIEHVKKALEKSPDVYHIDGCPIREEPLHLVPRSLRANFEKILGVKIEGDLCPVCRFRLLNEFDGKYEDFPVKQSSFSIRLPTLNAPLSDITRGSSSE